MLGVVNSILFVLHLMSMLNVATLNEQYFYVVIVTLFLNYLIFSCRMIVLPSDAHINLQHSQFASFTCNRIGCCIYTRLLIAACPLRLGDGLYACGQLTVQGGQNSLLLCAFTIYLKHLAPYVQ